MEKYQTTGRSVIRRPCPVVRYSNKVRIFSKENWSISKRNMELFHRLIKSIEITMADNWSQGELKIIKETKREREKKKGNLDLKGRAKSWLTKT